MSNYENNIYYYPEKHGLTPIAEFEYSDANYQFDTRVIWRHSNGEILMARDSGCSCPMPFEDYNSVADLEPFSLAVIEQEFREVTTPAYAGDVPNVSLQQAGEWMDTLRAALQLPAPNGDY